MKNLFFALLIATVCYLPMNVQAQQEEENIPKLENPLTAKYLKSKLRKSQPRLVYNSQTIKLLQKKLKTDPVIQNMYAAVKLKATAVFEQPLLVRELKGRRLLGVSRKMLYRINLLGVVYLVEKDKKVLDRINEEVLAVCNFSDWNPSHFLDVAEMSLAVALAIDWTAGDLPSSTIALAKKALIDKGLKPSWPENGRNPGWAYGSNNWNQVCNGGMIAAAIAVAKEEPDLSAKTIHRALDGLPHSLVEYGPDGVYPEGSTYWGYGTSFSVVTIAMLESAFATDFGMGDYPAFQESAVFRVLSNAPSGWYYNFADCGDERKKEGDLTLAWFAKKTGNKAFFEKERFLIKPESIDTLSRLSGASLMWVAQYQETAGMKMPTAWKGEGANPIVIFTGERDDEHTYYFGGKGGRGMVSHGNMDGGSFIFELNGVRWVVDPGNQNYHNLEKTGFDLWKKCQDCERWTLLTKNNYGHSTITINDQLHRVEGLVTLSEFKNTANPEAIFDIGSTLGSSVESASRKFVKDSPTSLVIEDNIVINDETKLITWQLMTQADVEIVDGGVILTQEGEKLAVENISHPELTISVISLDPAPMELDRQIEGLKRLEIRIPAWVVKGDTCTIKVRLSEK